MALYYALGISKCPNHHLFNHIDKVTGNLKKKKSGISIVASSILKFYSMSTPVIC